MCRCSFAHTSVCDDDDDDDDNDERFDSFTSHVLRCIVVAHFLHNASHGMGAKGDILCPATTITIRVFQSLR